MTSPEVLKELEEEERIKARFCIATGVAPSEYDQLTRPQIALWIEVVAEQNKR